MQRSPSNISIPRRIPSAYERTVQCLRNIATYLRRYRNLSVVQALQHVLRPLLRHREQERSEAEHIEEAIYQSLYQVVQSIERFQETLQHSADREFEVDVEIPILVSPTGRERAFVDIMLSTAQQRTENRERRDVIQIRFQENPNPSDANEASLSHNNSELSDYLYLDDEFYERLINRWREIPPRRAEEEQSPPRNFDDMVLGEGIAGATEEEIVGLPIVTATDNDVEQVCAICLEEFESITPMRRLPCEHVFHLNCARSWLLRNPSCPIDRRSIFEGP